MKQYSTIVFWGMLISFLGSLPPGTMNITAAQITAQQGRGPAIIFAIGSMLTEVIIVRLALTGMKQIIRRRRLFQVLELLTAGLLLAMTVGCFIAAGKMGGLANILPHYRFPPFATGVLLTTINPLHIPFWLGWTTVLMNKQVLSPVAVQYNWYVLGIGIGTIGGFLTFIYTGQFLISAFETNQFIICLIVGFILSVVCLLHIKKMIQSPLSIRYNKMSHHVLNKT